MKVLNMGESWIGIDNSFIIAFAILVIGAYLTSLHRKIAALENDLNNLKWDVFNSANGFYHVQSEPHPDQEKYTDY